jgi:hypothetical protein
MVGVLLLLNEVQEELLLDTTVQMQHLPNHSHGTLVQAKVITKRTTAQVLIHINMQAEPNKPNSLRAQVNNLLSQRANMAKDILCIKIKSVVMEQLQILSKRSLATLRLLLSTLKILKDMEVQLISNQQPRVMEFQLKTTKQCLQQHIKITTTKEHMTLIMLSNQQQRITTTRLSHNLRNQ